MRKKVKPATGGTISPTGALEMVIKINNQNVVVEVIPPNGLLEQDEEKKPLKPECETATTASDQEKLSDDAVPSADEDDVELSGDEKGGDDDDKKSVHNKSEKLRRAQLRASMDKLKLLVPLEDSNQKHTTVSLLRKARVFIQKLEEKERKNVIFKEQLQKEQRYLRKRFEQLQQVTKETPKSPSGPVSRPPVILKQPISAGSHSTANKYPANLPLSQSKTPPILKRKSIPESNSGMILVESLPNAMLPNAARTLEIPTGPAAVNSAAFELVTTQDQLLASQLSDNYCIIIDTGSLQQAL